MNCSRPVSTLSLPLPAIQYADFAAWQRGPAQESVIESQLGYWRERLAGELPVLELPSDRPRPAVATYRGALQKRPLPDGLANGI